MDTNKMHNLKSLAEAATGGEWTCSEKHDGRFWHIQSGGQAIGATHAAGRKSPMAGIFEANAKFIAAASPATVLALLAEIERLREDPHMRAIRSLRSDCADLMVERDQLKAENEALRKDAQRYRWLRDKQTFIWLIQDWFPGEAMLTNVDADIDAAMAKEASHG